MEFIHFINKSTLDSIKNKGLQTESHYQVFGFKMVKKIFLQKIILMR